MDNSQINQNDDPMLGKLIFDRYKLIKRLGAGSFGSIYAAEYQNQNYAIKFEEKDRGQNLLENEAYIMSYLHGPGLPIVKSYGYSSKHNILVMELMGKSLEDIFESFVVKKMSPRCVCNIGYQMIEILEYIHEKHIIHRDIKPDNFVIGRNEKRKYIYILDFGLSKKYRSSTTKKHYRIIKSKNLTGTARYASINALKGLTQSRRDDLEAVGYVLMYFLRGRLPWQGIPVKNKEDRYRKILEKKIETSAEELCYGYPREFTDYVNYTRNLLYEQDPEYYYLKNLFLNVLNREGFRIDCYYDWDKETINYFRDFKNVDNNRNNKSKNDSTSISTNQLFNMKDVNSFTSVENRAYNNNINKYNTNSNTISMVNYQINNKFNGMINSTTNNEGSTLYQKRNDPELTNANTNIKTNEAVNNIIKEQNKYNYNSITKGNNNIQKNYIQNGDIQNGNIQNGNIQNGNIQNGNIQNGNIQKSNVQNGNIQNGNIQKSNVQKSNVQNNNVQNNNNNSQNNYVNNVKNIHAKNNINDNKEKQQLNQENNYAKNKRKEIDNDQKKNGGVYLPRSEKDNKCCLIF